MVQECVIVQVGASEVLFGCKPYEDDSHDHRPVDGIIHLHTALPAADQAVFTETDKELVKAALIET